MGLLIALALPLVATADTPPVQEARPEITVPADGFLRHHPSGLRLPRDVGGPAYIHLATLTEISAGRVILTYGPISVIVSRPTAAADAIITPPGWRDDPDAPALPSLLFWGEGVQPLTHSFLHAEGQPAYDWVAFVAVVSGWQIEMSSLYQPGDRETVIRMGEAVWAMIASANERAPD